MHSEKLKATALGPSDGATLDLDALRAFLAIADRGGVSAAADRIGRTPAAVSMQLKKLETVLGATLFSRPNASSADGGRRGMRLTPAGERLLGPARRMLDLEAEALAAFRPGALTGEARLGLIDDFSGVALSEVLSAFARTHPDVTVTVALGPSATLAAKLDAGVLDLALIAPGGPIEWRDADRVATEEPLVWFGALGGSAHLREPTPIAVASEDCAWRHRTIEAFARVSRRYRVAYTSDTYAGQRAAVSADLAIAPLPRSVAGAELTEIPPSAGLPELGRTRVALRIAEAPSDPATACALADQIIEVLTRTRLAATENAR